MADVSHFRTIFHLDMDAFYAAIEQRDDPSLRGKPVVVGSPPDKRGVVCTASYEARRYGIHSAMPSRTAYSRCPHAVFLSPRMSHYADVSRQLMTILRTLTPQVEKLSIDEAFLDMTPFMRESSMRMRAALELKERIRRDLALTASIGIAPNKFLAKLASDLEKPDGLTVTPWGDAEIRTFLAPLPVERIWRVGKATAARLHEANLRTIGDIQRMGYTYLDRVFSGGMTDHLWALAHGRDERPVVTEYDEKSISHEETFGVDCCDPDEVRRVLIFLVEKVGNRLRKAAKLAGTAQIKVRFSDFTTITRQRRFPGVVDDDQSLISSAVSLFDGLQINQPVRLIGFGVHELCDAGAIMRQPELFADSGHTNPGAGVTALDDALDEIRQRFGQQAITRGMPCLHGVDK